MAYKRKRMPVRRFNKGRYTKRSRSRMTVNTVKKIAKSVVMRKVEPKHKSFNTGKYELYHNTFNTYRINTDNQMPAEGTGDDQRIGDRIYTTGFKLRLLLGQKSDRPNVTFKIYVMKVPKGQGYAYANFFSKMVPKHYRQCSTG
ncbi:putative capsid protein [Callinectes sapidus associated circular virus]|uniref:putative capsid protein n=1 Tax=Callinectes sapidus associated circular virus TaxID=1692246 RepID=UPI0006A73B7C|nr:putative capsid protein [Callinectes sapidus associated circular virus]AKV62267.1 putative capsid protein [Callinectes sapidus associated circular virus]